VSTPYSISRLTPGDVVEAVHADLVLLEATYAHLATPDFAARRWAEADERIAQLGVELDEADEARAAGRTPRAEHWLARSPRGVIVGLVSVVHGGPEPWEAEVVGDAWRPSGVDTILGHLYTMPGVHGSGLADELLDVALPDGAPASLWVMVDNARAVAFYRRRGFVIDLGPVPSGESWGAMPMWRLVRR